MILDRIVCSTRKLLCNESPFVSVLLMKFYNLSILLFSPLVIINAWVKMIVPSLPTLFSNSAWKMTSDVAPVLRSLPPGPALAAPVQTIRPMPSLKCQWLSLPPASGAPISSTQNSSFRTPPAIPPPIPAFSPSPLPSLRAGKRGAGEVKE